ncbi:MAG: transcription antitermination factor NusB [Polyangiaceae bacterium]
MSPLSARSIARAVLVRVIEDRAFAAAALDAEIARHPQLDRRDVGLATELVYGVLRTRGFLEEQLRARSTRDLPRAVELRASLLIGAYTLFFLDRIPAFAAVNEAVEAVRAIESNAAGYANALLRSIARDLETRPRPTLATAIAEGAPGWLRGALRRSLGRGDASKFLAAIADVPPLGLATRSAEDRDRVVARLVEAHPDLDFAPSAMSPRGVLVRGGVHPSKLTGIDVDFIVQEEGAQRVAMALEARPGDRVLDACAGRGNKSWFLAHAVGPDGRVTATDLHPKKLEVLARYALPHAVEVRGVDWSVGGAGLRTDFDRVLVDAPCSGIGTLRRRPEIQWLRERETVAELAALQAKILTNAAKHVRDGGRLVYAVCSVLAEECEAVVEAFGQPPEQALRLLPHADGTDGYFIAVFTVRRSS